MRSGASSKDYLFSQATAADVPALCTLVNSAYRGESSKKGWTTEADLLGGQRVDAESLFDFLSASDHAILLLRAQVTNHIVACVSLDFSHEACDGRSHACYLGMLTVDPGLQAAGLGKRLLAEAEIFASRRDARAMVISVIQFRTELIDWYLRRGYKSTGKTKSFPYGNRRFGEPKRRDLHFLVFEKSLAKI